MNTGSADISVDLTLEGAAAAGSASIRPASRAQLDALLAVLLDDRDITEGLIRTMHAERVIVWDSVRIVIEGDLSLVLIDPNRMRQSPPLWQRGLVYPLKPLLELDGLWVLQNMSGVIQACSKSTWPEAKKIIDPLEHQATESVRGVLHLFKPLRAMFLPPVGRAVQRSFQSLHDRRQTAIGLAFRMYQCEHGRPPQDLSDLVPEYLPTTPVNPLREGQAQYLLQDLGLGALAVPTAGDTAKSDETDGDDE